MGSIKSKAKKLRLAKAAKQTKWAPLWLVPRIEKGLRKIHPARYTTKKRHWRKHKIDD